MKIPALALVIIGWDGGCIGAGTSDCWLKDCSGGVGEDGKCGKDEEEEEEEKAGDECNGAGGEDEAAEEVDWEGSIALSLNPEESYTGIETDETLNMGYL